MYRIKAQKGITLVALVITIVVMIILVGVTITVSLKGGLFSKANEATSQMQIEAEKEELLTAALGTLGRNGKVNLDELDNNLPEGFTGSNGQYTSSTGNRYQVTEDADIILLDGTEEEPETPVVPPANPTITITPETITGEIETGTTGTEVGTITATVSNVDGGLTWSITPENSGLELVDTDNANVKKVTASKAVENATITVSYGTVSDTCSVTITEEEAEQEYELSGKWTFNNTVDVQGGLESFGEQWSDDGSSYFYLDIEFLSGSYNYIGMALDYIGPEGPYTLFYELEDISDPIFRDGSWEMSEEYKTVDFGSTPQPVSQEFYEWFTANAIQQQATEISFTLAGTPYTTTAGTTWKNWIIENDMLNTFDISYMDPPYDVDLSKRIFNSAGVPLIHESLYYPCYGDIINSGSYAWDISVMP